MKRKLFAADFQSTNDEHMRILKDMGITMVSLADGRVQLLHTSVNVSYTVIQIGHFFIITILLSIAHIIQF